MENMTDQITSDLISKITKQQEEIIKQKLIEKGFGNLIEGMTQKRFPRIASVHTQDAKYYYADNGSPNGVFICGFTQPCVAPTDDYSGNSLSITMSFNLITEEPLSLMIF